MFKNTLIVVLLMVIFVYFWGDSPSKECPVEKKTPRMEGGCVIQKSGDTEIRTCG